MVKSMNKENNYLSIAEDKKRIFDQMATMHFKLSDKYKCWSNIEDTIEIVISVSLCGITFLDYEKYFSISIEKPSLVVGCISIILLAFTLIKQNLNHKQLCEKHQLAGKMYAKGKLDLATKITEWTANGIDDIEILNYLDSHFGTLNDLPQIPENQFNRLKHAHQSKVAMSKFLDRHQNEPWIICKFKFWFNYKEFEQKKTNEPELNKK